MLPRSNNIHQNGSISKTAVKELRSPVQNDKILKLSFGKLQHFVTLRGVPQRVYGGVSTPPSRPSLAQL